MRKVCMAVLAVLVVVGWGRPAEASSITVSGSTLGCFGTGCNAFALTASSGATYDLNFIGLTSFSTTTDSAGSASFTLGTLDRGNTNWGSSTAPLSFSLQVTFTVPTGIGGSPTTYTAVITGTSTGGGGPEDVNFDNSFTQFNYSNASGFGSFDFGIPTDPQVAKNTRGPNGTPVAITGVIRNATFSPTSTPPTPAPVPEPASLALLGTGLALLYVRLRKPAPKA